MIIARSQAEPFTIPVEYHNASQPSSLGTDGLYHPLLTYGDGSPIPVEWLERRFQIVVETHVLVKWQHGVVHLLFDMRHDLLDMSVAITG